MMWWESADLPNVEYIHVEICRKVYFGFYNKLIKRFHGFMFNVQVNRYNTVWFANTVFISSPIFHRNYVYSSQGNLKPELIPFPSSK